MNQWSAMEHRRILQVLRDIQEKLMDKMFGQVFHSLIYLKFGM